MSRKDACILRAYNSTSMIRFSPVVSCELSPYGLYYFDAPYFILGDVSDWFKMRLSVFLTRAKRLPIVFEVGDLIVQVNRECKTATMSKELRYAYEEGSKVQTFLHPIKNAHPKKKQILIV